jgi:hypothetical protein
MKKKTKKTWVTPFGLRCLYLAVGIVAGYFGTRFWWNNLNPQWLKGAPLQILAVFFFWMAIPNRIPLKDLPDKKNRVRPLPGPPARSFLFLVVPAAIGQGLFALDLPVWGLAFWAAALGSLWLARDAAGGKPPAGILKNETAWLGAVLLFACLMRFPFAAQHTAGLQVDEANNIVYGSRVLSGEIATPFCTVGVVEHTFHHYLLAPALWLFGETCTTGRVFSAVVSIAALYFFCLLCRFFFSPAASLLATFLMSVGWWFLFYSLSPFQNVTVCFFVILVVYFLERGLRSGRKVDFWAAGMITAFCCMEYLSGRLVPLIAAFSVFLFLLVRGKAFWKAYWPLFLLMLLAFLWVLTPFIYFGIHYPDQIFQRTAELNVFSEMKRTGHFWLLPEKIGWTLLSLVWPNLDADRRFCPLGYSQMDPFSGVFMLFGLLLALIGLKKRENIYMLVGFAFGIATNAFAVQGANANPHMVNCERGFIVVPFLFLMVGRFADWMLAFSRLLKPLWKTAGKVLLALGLVFAVAWNVKAYYFGFKNPLQYNSLGFPHIRAVEVMKRNYPRAHIVALYSSYPSTEQVLTRGCVKVTEMLSDKRMELPIRLKAEKNVLFVIDPWEFDELRFRRTYPNAIWSELKNALGEVNFKIAEVTMKDIEAAQKGLELKGVLQ